jgi:predicted AAA+ superfamily ATPase
VEAAVGAHLYAETQGSGGGLYWWGEGLFEVDYVVKSGESLLGIEVKSGRIRGKHAGSEVFRKKWPRSKTLLVGEQGVSLGEFLGHKITDYLK